MYKVVIVDDEPIIVEGLTRSIHWERWDCQVVATAESGKEGLAIVEKEHPDILFSDIRMPHMDGLTMIAAIKSAYPHTEVSILTGFSDFEYAREAIRLGVTRFLVKPSKMDELEEAVEAMVHNLREREELENVEKLYGRQTSMGQALPRLAVDSATTEVADEEEVSEENDETVDSAASSFIVNNALKYMEENYREKLKLQDVADHVYVSQWHLSKLLNRYKAQSFSDLLNNIRIDKAKELLQDPSLRIGEIAEQVGFLDMAHFSRVFKKQTGISANEYRNSLK